MKKTVVMAMTVGIFLMMCGFAMAENTAQGNDGILLCQGNYVPPYGTYQCSFSTFPGIGPGTIATWYESGWTVNGTTYPGGISGSYGPIPGGFSWTNGVSVCQWRYVGP